METELRTRFITHEGRPILFLDYSAIDDREVAFRAIAASRRIIGQQPRNSLLTLTFVEGALHDAEIARALKELAVHNKPFVKAAAVVGLNTLQRVIYRAVTAFSRRDIAAFDDLDAAKDWLVQHA